MSNVSLLDKACLKPIEGEDNDLDNIATTKWFLIADNTFDGIKSRAVLSPNDLSSYKNVSVCPNWVMEERE